MTRGGGFLMQWARDRSSLWNGRAVACIIDLVVAPYYSVASTGSVRPYHDL